MSAAFRDNFEQLVGLKCSIVQCMVQHDGIYLVILTMTSSMVEQERVWNGFESMFRVSILRHLLHLVLQGLGHQGVSTPGSSTS